MARKARNGIVYPYKVERKKHLADGNVKIYTSYEFKVDGNVEGSQPDTRRIVDGPSRRVRLECRNHRWS